MSSATSSELALVRSEIKIWERSFRAEQGRDPGREDIKARPEMTAKYKLYKSLSKSTPAQALLSTSTSTSTSSSIPHRPSVRPITVPPNSTSSSLPTLTPTQSNSNSFFQSISSLSSTSMAGTPVASSSSTSITTTTPITATMSNTANNGRLISTQTPVMDDRSNPFLESLSTSRPSASRSNGASGLKNDEKGKRKGSRAVGLERTKSGVLEGSGNPFLSPPGTTSDASASGVPEGLRSVRAGTTSTTTISTPKKRRDDGTALGVRSSPSNRGGPYGPIKSDPNHFDPFSSPSSSTSTSRRAAVAAGGGSREGEEQPRGFIFAPSPSRLKSLLVGNSIARSPGGMMGGASTTTGASSSSPLRTGTLGMGITPRSKARKRLRGEEVEETPKGRRRGGGEQARGGFKGWMSEEDVGEDEIEGEDEDEVLGPTPRKEGGAERRRGFKVLFEGDEEDVGDEGEELGMGMGMGSEVGRGKGGSVRRKKEGGAIGADDGLGKMFKRRKIEDGSDRTKADAMKDERLVTPRKATTGGTQTTTPRPSGSTPLKGKKLAFLAQLEMEDAGDVPDPLQDVPDPDLERSPEGRTGIRVEEDLVREIEWSDSDPDVESLMTNGNTGGMDVDMSLPKRRMTRVKIEPYRLDQQRRIAAAGGTIQARDLRSGGRHFERTASTKSVGEAGRDGATNGNVGEHGEVDEGFDGDGGRDGTTNDDETQGLSRLTLRSPENDVLRKTMAYHERKAMAIFSSKAANDLRLRRKGIEIYAAGEGIDGEQDEDDADPYGHEREVDAGDDDWDSEPDGWKGVGLGVDDDW